jgi:UPF0271 protein
MSNIFFKVLRSGINTTYQDDGRFGLQHYGVPVGGCMDKESFFLSNALVGNKTKEGVIEFAYQGPLLELKKGNTKIAITGNVIFKIIYSDNKIIDGKCNRSYNINEGDRIDILATKDSVYGYLAVQGGFNLKPFFNSISTFSKACIGPNQGKKIEINDRVILNENIKDKKNFGTNILNDKNNIIKVIKGPQYDYFSNKSKKNFFSTSYKITNLTDRMGTRLEGKTIENIVSTNIRSEGIIKGAIQVPADGQPIILLTDHPTIGGYPKIAHVISADYDLLVQKKPGTNILFKCIELIEAEQLYKEKQKKISKIINNMRELN